MPFWEYLDWITPALSLASRARGKTDTIAVESRFGDAVCFILKRAGIKIKYPSDYRGWFGFDVPKEDAERARKLIEDCFKGDY